MVKEECIQTQATKTIVVVGAGGAGLSIVGSILSNPSTSDCQIIWIDPKFGEGGRLTNFLRVPSNTKVDLFVRYALDRNVFVEAWEKCDCKEMTSLQDLKDLPSEKGCELGFAVKMVQQLSVNLCMTFPDKIKSIKSHCSSIKLGTDGSIQVTVKGGESFLASKVILATGCYPRPSPFFQDKSLDPEPFMNYPIIQNAAQEVAGKTVAVIGSSHSAILILRNLISTQDPNLRPKKVINFYRDPLKFAEYLPDGTIKYDNTGLKGLVADWAREYLLNGSEVCCDGLLERVHIPSGKIKEEYEVPGIDSYIWAIGYVRNTLPEIIKDDQTLTIDEHGQFGELIDSSGQMIQGLYGIGIAFPERVKVEEDGIENAVGLWKFCEYSKRIVNAFE